MCLRLHPVGPQGLACNRGTHPPPLPIYVAKVPLMADVPGGEEPQRTGEPALARKVRGHIILGSRDLEALALLCRERETVRRGSVLLDRERSGERAFLVEHGWAMRFSILPDGRRQILAFVLPGDVFGLSGLILGYPSESVAAITPITVSRL